MKVVASFLSNSYLRTRIEKKTNSKREGPNKVFLFYFYLAGITSGTTRGSLINTKFNHLKEDDSMAIVEFIGMTVLAIVIVAAVTVVLINDRNAQCREMISKGESRTLDKR